MKPFVQMLSAAIVLGGASTASAHDLGSLPHSHPHAGLFATSEGAFALVVLLGLMTAWALRSLLRRGGRLGHPEGQRPVRPRRPLPQL